MFRPSKPLREAFCGGVLIALALAGVIGSRGRTFDRTTAQRPASPNHLEVRTHDVGPPPPDPAVLRVCADPNNLPFSNNRQQGFENALAQLVAKELKKRVEYYWQPQRRGFIRTTLNAGWCDLIVGLLAGADSVQTTRPYYRSTYVFVARRGAGSQIRSLDDSRLHRIRIGVEMTGEDYGNPPALQALAKRHIIDNVRGYLVYGDYSKPDPPRRVIDAVANREVDTAIAWGPMAGFFAARSAVPLTVVPVTPSRDGAMLTFAFDIAMGVRRADMTLRDALNEVIAARRLDINKLLMRFNVPLLAKGDSS